MAFREFAKKGNHFWGRRILARIGAKSEKSYDGAPKEPCMYEPVPPADPRGSGAAADLDPRSPGRVRALSVCPAPLFPGGGAIQGVRG